MDFNPRNEGALVFQGEDTFCGSISSRIFMGGRQEMRNKQGRGALTFCWQRLLAPLLVLLAIQKSDFSCTSPTLLLHVFTVNTLSQPNSPVFYHFTQSSLPLFNWKTFCLLLPNHMMWDKCSNPSLWAFKDCNTTFTRQLFDSKMDKLQSYSWPPSRLQRDRGLKLVLLIKR